MTAMVLKLRSHDLNRDVVQALVQSMLHPMIDEIAVLSAVIAYPDLLKVLPNLADEFADADVDDAVQVLIMAHDQDEAPADLRILFAKLRDKAPNPLTPERIPAAIVELLEAYEP
jgi:hypothetical protein